MLVRSSPVNQPLPPFCIPIPSSLSLISRQDFPGGTKIFPFLINCFQRPHISYFTPNYKPTFFQMTFSNLEQATLPPLRAGAASASVRLPGIEYIHSLHDSPRQSRMLPLHAPHVSVPSSRKFSTSSSATNESRSPSPSLSDASSSSLVNPSVRSLSRSPSESRHAQPFMRLVPSDMHNADAVVLIPPPGPGPRKPLLLVGPALKLVSHPQRHIARGARIYPYRKDSRPSLSRKSSWALTDCSEL